MDRTRWPLVFLLIGSGIVASMQSGKAPLAIASIRVELGVGLVVAGLIVSPFSGMTGAAGALAGIFGDRYGHRNMLMLGYGFLVTGAVGGSFAPDGDWLLASRVVEGIGFVAILVGSPALIARAAQPSDHRLAFGLYGINFPAGVSVMMAVSPLILVPLGWRGLWLVNAGLCVAMALVLWAATRSIGDAAWRASQGEISRGGTARGRTFADLWIVLRSPGPWVVALCFMTYGILWSAVVFWLPTYMIERVGRSPLTAALVGAAVVFGNVIGNIAGARLNHDKPRSVPLIALAGAGMAVLVLFVFDPGTPEPLRYGLAFVFSMVGGLVPSSSLASVQSLTPRPDLVGSVLGLIFQASHLGVFLGPPVMAAFVALAVADTRTGWDRAGAPFALLGVIIILLAGLLWLALRRRQNA
jgi:DHA1 family inner membrane transport protein